MTENGWAMAFLAPLERALRRVHNERGFSLVELMVAQGIILFSLLSLAYTTTVGFQDIALARQRDTANGLANRAIEQVRALPYDTVKRGLANADLPGGDPAIRTSGCPSGHAYCYRSNPPSETTPCTAAVTPACEAIARGTLVGGSPPEPLFPHRQTVTIGPTDFTRAVYVTYYNGGSGIVPGAFRVTAVVTWTEGRRGVPARVQAQTVVFSPEGCRSTATHPFAAPCQPFVYATAQIPTGTIRLTPTPNTGINGVRGTDFELATLYTIGQSVNGQAEQITAATARSVAPGIDFKRLGINRQNGGQAVLETAADNDPGQPGPEDDPSSGPFPATVTGGTASTLNVADDDELAAVYQPAGSDAITSGSTMTANTAHPCGGQTDELPCARASSVQNTSSTSFFRLEIDQGPVDLSPAIIARLTGTGGTNSALIHRDAVTALDGSMGAQVTRNLATLQLGGLPANVSGPAGWDTARGLVRVSGYSATLEAQAGRSVVAMPLSAAVTGGTVEYWNGTGYTTITAAQMNQAAPVLFTTTFDRTVAIGGQNVRVVMTGSFQAGGVSTSSVGTATDRTAAEALARPALFGSLTYRLTIGPITDVEHLQADLTMDVNMGTQRATASYTASPGAT